MKKLPLFFWLAVFFITSCHAVPTNSGAGVSGDNAEPMLPANQHTVTLEGQSELTHWWKNTNFPIAYEGQFKELAEWKAAPGKIIVPYYGGKELSSDISIIPESTYEAAGMYFRYYTEAVTCIVQVYRADSAKLTHIRENLCWYRFGKNTMNEPTDTTIGTVTLGGVEVAYGLVCSEPMARQYLTFLYGDRYIVTVAYMDSSTVSLWDFLQDLSFTEVSVC